MQARIPGPRAAWLRPDERGQGVAVVSVSETPGRRVEKAWTGGLCHDRRFLARHPAPHAAAVRAGRKPDDTIEGDADGTASPADALPAHWVDQLSASSRSATGAMRPAGTALTRPDVKADWAEVGGFTRP